MPIYDIKGNKIVTENNSILQSKNLPLHMAYCSGNSSSCSALFLTDIHGDADRFRRFVTLANLGRDNSAHAIQNIPFDVAICGGDIIHNNVTETDADTFEGVARGGSSWYRDEIKSFKTPFLCTVGNHDCGWTSTTESYTTEDVYDQYIHGTTLANADSLPYGYYDDTLHNMRFIVLYDFDSGIVEYAKSQGSSSLVARRGFAKIYGQDQIDWLISTLNSVPSGYGVVVVGHTMQLFKNVEIVEGFGVSTLSSKISTIARESYSAQTRTSGTTQGIIADIIKAYIDRGTLSATYAYSGNNWWSSSISIIDDVVVDADFSNANGTFMCYVCGHYHVDGVIKCTASGYTNQTMIMLAQGTCEQSQRGDSLIPRCADTDTQDCLLGLVFDVANQVVRITKIGSSFSGDGVDRAHFDIDVS